MFIKAGIFIFDQKCSAELKKNRCAQGWHFSCTSFFPLTQSVEYVISCICGCVVLSQFYQYCHYKKEKNNSTHIRTPDIFLNEQLLTKKNKHLHDICLCNILVAIV